jgi:hypothetical protein
LYSKKKIVIIKYVVFLWPLTTGDVWWQDGQIKEEEEALPHIATHHPSIL